MVLKERRNFLKNSFLSSVIFLTCSGELFGATTPMQTISQVYEDLFPDIQNGPSVGSVNAVAYLEKILHHSRVTDENKRFIREGVKWLNEEALAKYKKRYIQLSSLQREKILINISETGWGDSWIENIMSYFLEAMLGDPVYGGNRSQTGWSWLNHKAGLPRPSKELL